MNTIFKTIALIVCVAAPAVSFAQTSNDPTSRAQVRAQLVQLEHAGYKPSKLHYPADIQAAEARIGVHNAAAANGAANGGTGYGPPAAGSSQYGNHASKARMQQFYNHP
ncbi:DUF4148 domain-containing protein [Paraburkholderia sp. Cpub6]|uniref:DUF4148 domain-containing protein n=1 Tax=Paraburkholderia sp. Cpub6 TaxID=2723094 RepID=UPI0016182C54|nr:DUF4148 domain-containing protein [Paraburkholderia sp. Cpub6]MBB5461121.1 hypothetical protein [Paraburkholderia sp. Cpub6]